MNSARPIEDLVAVPRGVVFVQWGEIWMAEFDTQSVRSLVSEGADLHGLATDGSWLYWLGHESNGRLELGTDNTASLPRFARPGGQHDLVVGDVLYGLGDRNTVWSIEGSHVSRVQLGLKADTRVFGGSIGAGDRVVVFPALGPDGAFLWRLHVGGKAHRVETKRIFARSWSVDQRGRLVFIRGNQVLRLSRKSNRAKLLFEKDGVRALCWCGANVCTFSDGELRSHVPGDKKSELLAEGLGEVSSVSCSAAVVAWTAPSAGDSTQLAAVNLSGSPPDPSSRP